MCRKKMIGFTFCSLLLIILNSDNLNAQVTKTNDNGVKIDSSKNESIKQESKFPFMNNAHNQNRIKAKAEEYKRRRAETDSLAKKKGIPIRKTFKDGTVLILDRFENGFPVYTKIGFHSRKRIFPKDSTIKK